MQDLWTNRSSLGDFVINGIRLIPDDISYIYIAVAFFTEEEVVKELAHKGHVRMIVRLGYPTNPKALQKLISNPNIEIRYYTDKSFHPKVYIFGDRVAFVGSANLTKSALQTNQEVVVSIGSEDPRFSELLSLFSDYWNEAEVLTPKVISSYESIYNNFSQSINGIYRMDEETQLKIGKTTFSNINRGQRKKTKEKVFLDDFRKSYQESVTAFNKIQAVYKSAGRRKNNADIPIRLEIDAFVNFVREEYAKGETWREQPIAWNEVLILGHIKEWLDAEWPYYDETICNENYPRLNGILGSKISINDASYDEILDALEVVHSFNEQMRFVAGGLEALRTLFKARNDIERTKSSLIHLLHGSGDIVERMTDLIYDSSYKLEQFGQSNVQELVGWINNEKLPVINGRTTKVFRYYGFDVRQL